MFSALSFPSAAVLALLLAVSADSGHASATTLAADSPRRDPSPPIPAPRRDPASPAFAADPAAKAAALWDLCSCNRAAHDAAAQGEDDRGHTHAVTFASAAALRFCRRSIGAPSTRPPETRAAPSFRLCRLDWQKTTQGAPQPRRDAVESSLTAPAARTGMRDLDDRVIEEARLNRSLLASCGCEPPTQQDPAFLADPVRTAIDPAQAAADPPSSDPPPDPPPPDPPPPDPPPPPCVDHLAQTAAGAVRMTGAHGAQ